MLDLLGVLCEARPAWSLHVLETDIFPSMNSFVVYGRHGWSGLQKVKVGIAIGTTKSALPLVLCP